MGGRHQLLRTLVAADVARDGETSSTMVRAGLLRDILDEHAELLEAARAGLLHVEAEIEEREFEKTADEIAQDQFLPMFRERADTIRAAILKATGSRAHGEDIDGRGE